MRNRNVFVQLTQKRHRVGFLLTDGVGHEATAASSAAIAADAACLTNGPRRVLMLREATSWVRWMPFAALCRWNTCFDQ